MIEQPSLASTDYNRSVNAENWQAQQRINDTTISQLLWLVSRFSPVGSPNIANTLTWLLSEQQQTVITSSACLGNYL